MTIGIKGEMTREGGGGEEMAALAQVLFQKMKKTLQRGGAKKTGFRRLRGKARSLFEGREKTLKSAPTGREKGRTTMGGGRFGQVGTL